LLLKLVTERSTSEFFSISQDVVTENEFEKRLLADVIPPNDIGVTFDDIGALENVKDTLKELVMLPLQRPELFCKGQLTKVASLSLIMLEISCMAVLEFPFEPMLYSRLVEPSRHGTDKATSRD